MSHIKITLKKPTIYQKKKKITTQAEHHNPSKTPRPKQNTIPTANTHQRPKSHPTTVSHQNHHSITPHKHPKSLHNQNKIIVYLLLKKKTEK